MRLIGRGFVGEMFLEAHPFAQSSRHPELVSGSICQSIPAPIVTSHAVTRGCAFFRAKGAAARWALNQVQGDSPWRFGDKGNYWPKPRNALGVGRQILAS